MDAIELLIQDHRKVDQLFEQIQKEKDPTKKGQTFEKINQELTLHSELEETYFYPAVKDAQSTHEIVVESEHEHKTVETLLHDLEKLTAGSDDFEAKLKFLIDDVKHHVKEEEGELFPKAKEILGEPKLQDLGAKMEEHKMAKVGKK